jgi:hypothetical protein
MGQPAGAGADQKVVRIRRWSILNRFYFANGRMLHLIEAMCSSKSGGNLTSISMERPFIKKRSMLGIIVGAAVLSAAPFSLHWSHEKNVALSLDRADARIGRPGTALSVAGVHRRAYRRAYRGAVYGGAAANSSPTNSTASS